MIDLSEIRSKYPEYKDISDKELSGMLYKKFYSDMPIEEFNKKVMQLPIDTTSALSKAAQAGRNANPFIQGALNLVGGLTLGSGDELAGVGSGAISALKGEGYGKGYDEGSQYVREAIKQGEKDNPIASVFGNIAGGLPLGFFGAANKAKTVLEAIGRASGVGGVTGGAEAIGNENSSDIEKRLMAGAKGVPIGAGVGAGLSAFGAAGKKLYDLISDRITNKGLQNIADKNLLSVINKDNSDIPTRLKDLGEEATVADASGGYAIEKLRQLTKAKGKAEDLANALIERRKDQRAGRIIETTDKALNPTGAKYYNTIDDYIASKKEKSQPLYNQIKDVNIPIDDDIRSLINSAKESHSGVNKKLRAQGKSLIDFDNLVKKPIPTFTTKEGATVNLIGEGKDAKYMLDGVNITKGVNAGRTTLLKTEDAEKTIPFDVLNKMKSKIGSLGDLATEKQNDKDYGRILQELRAAIDSKLDAVSPKNEGGSIYRQASDIYAGKSRLEQAIKDGRGIGSKKSIDIAQEMKNMSPSEVEAYRIGAGQNLKETIGGQGGTQPFLNMKGMPELEDKYRNIFGNEYEKFAKTLKNENELKNLESIKPNNVAEKEFANEGIDANLAGSAAQAAFRAVYGGIPNVQPVASRLATTWNNFVTPQASRDTLAKMLLLQGDEAALGVGEASLRNQAFADALSKYRSRNANLTGIGAGKIAGQQQEQTQ